MTELPHVYGPPSTPCGECGHEWDYPEDADVCCTFVFSDDPARCCRCECDTCGGPLPLVEAEPESFTVF